MSTSSTNTMPTTPAPIAPWPQIPGGHPWARERRGRVTVGLQAVARPGADAAAVVQRAGLLAEELGYDAFYLGDHPALAVDPWLHLAALATRTSRIRLGTLVACSLFRPAVVTARLAADIDNLSAGRLVLGLGIGWDATEFAMLGLPFPPVPERNRHLLETLHVMQGAWGDAPFTFHGQQVQVDGVQVRPAPVQSPRPPLVIAGAGAKVTLRRVAQWADACNFGASPQVGGVQNAEDVQRTLDILRRHCDAVSRDDAEILRSYFTSWVILARTDAEANAKLDRYYPQGLTPAQRATRVVGSPATVAAHYRALAAAGIEHFICQTQDAEDLETIELLATEVMPQLQG